MIAWLASLWHIVNDHFAWPAHVFVMRHAILPFAHFVTSPFMIGAALDTAKMLVVMTAVIGMLLIHPRTRRVSLATVKFVHRHSPRWAKLAIIVAGLVPGQADEFLLVAILLWPILRNEFQRRVFARVIRTQWRG